MHRILPVLLAALVCVPAATAKQGKAVVVLGPSGRPLVEPFAPFAGVFAGFERTATSAVPSAPYVLVYPLMEQGVPMRPGRWYPGEGVLCSGWRTGVEAGCTAAPQLRGWLGRGIATGLFRGASTHLAGLTRRGLPLPVASNEATAIEMALNQLGSAGTPPADCVPFAGRWAGPRAPLRPTSFCVSPAGGVYAGGHHYPLARSAARFVVG